MEYHMNNFMYNYSCNHDIKTRTSEIYATRVDVTKHHITHGRQDSNIAKHEWLTRQTMHV